ncbi:MAG: indole-3-glycerol phosphate synthase TrpC [Planctomycetota bacterium]|jgi:indole-3-glycerol phosphate synthase
MGFLERVLEQKQTELAYKKRRRPVEALRKSCTSVAPPVRDFRAAVAGDGGGDAGSRAVVDHRGREGGRARIIAELKARTPSIESFAHSQSLLELAWVYEQVGAAAISVVTDEPNFGTSLEDAAAASALTQLPVLVKDFVVDPYQILEARAHGADAILLIARILSPDQLASLLDLAGSLGMAALVETHNEDEIHTALACQASIIGVNNRDLDTLEISLETTRRLAPLVPGGVALVAESGIRTRRDVETLAAAGAGAFLVGGTLLDAASPSAKLRELIDGGPGDQTKE